MRIGFAAALTAAALFAQAPDPVKVGGLTLTGSVRERVESWSWFQGEADSNYTYSGTQIRLGIGENFDRLDWYFELEAPVLLWLPEHSVGPGAEGQYGGGASHYVANDDVRNAASLFPKQGYLRFKFRSVQALRIGRFELSDAGGTVPRDATLAAVKRDRLTNRLVGPVGWSHVGRGYDGLQYTYGGKTNVTLAAARPTRGVYQVDGWGDLNVAIGYCSITRPIEAKHGAAEWRVFALQYEDWRDVLKTDNRPLAVRRADHDRIQITTAGGHYLQVFDTKAGNFDVMFWGALQAGSWGTLAHRAGSFAAEGGYQPPLRLKPWLRAGIDSSTGDNNPNDSRHTTFFQVLPTTRQYAKFPFYNLMNLRDVFGEAILRPDKVLTLRTSVRSLSLVSANDLWYSGSGAYQPWTFGYTGRPSNGHSGLATLYDLTAEWRAAEHVTLTGYVGAARGGGVPASIYLRGKNAELGYIEALYRF
jgi:hypothetical protein